MDADAVTVIAQALAAGAAAGVKDTATTAVTDAYAGLKQLITDRYQQVDLSAVEKKPDSEAKRTSLAEDLAEVGAGADAELLEAAREMIVTVNAHAADTGPAIGIDLERVEATALRIRDVTSGGTGIRARDLRVTGDIDISGIHTGRRAEPPGP